MNLITQVRKITPYFVKRVLWYAITKVPSRFELPFQYWYNKLRSPLEEEMEILKELAGDRKTAIDIGANIGLYSYYLSKICDRVEAFEPNPTCLRVLQNYNAKNVFTHNVGLSSNIGVLELHIPIVDGKEMLGHATVNSINTEHLSMKIPIKTLDEYEFDQVSFVKIDVEGHELDVIKGAQQTLLREKPNLLIEIEQRHLDYPMSRIFDKLGQIGYSGYFLYEAVLRPLAEFSYEIHQKAALEVDSTRKYVNNFIFKPDK
ncbi:MAG: FkbM family methyltransferase [Methylovulum miyakonense]|uniref:FkbM family methyltransferase n=1 Tax=Methylovulum miyakonense TaxID=645578 RepID=UPI003BB5FFB1